MNFKQLIPTARLYILKCIVGINCELRLPTSMYVFKLYAFALFSTCCCINVMKQIECFRNFKWVR